MKSVFQGSHEVDFQSKRKIPCSVVKIEITAIQLHSQTRNFVVYLQINSLIRLNSYNKFICSPIKISTKIPIVQITWHMPELYPYLSSEPKTTQQLNISKRGCGYLESINRWHQTIMIYKVKFISSTYLLLCNAFPAFIRKGTPSHLALSMKRAAAANVGVKLPLGTVLSSTYAGYVTPPLVWLLY